MEPGRELDALVAENIIGRCAHRLVRIKAHHQCRKCDEEFWGLAWHEGYCAFPSYSTDIAAAWTVVEKLADMGYVVSVCWGPGRGGRRYASVQMQLGMALVADLTFRNPRDMDAVGETAPLAICLAALKAVGVEVKNETGQGA